MSKGRVRTVFNNQRGRRAVNKLCHKKKNTTVYRDTSQPQDERLVECNLFVFKLNWKIMVHPPATNVKQKSSKSSGCCKVILWNVGNRSVEVDRLQGRKKKSSRFDLTLSPWVDWNDWQSSLKIRNVCVLTCVHELILHTIRCPVHLYPETGKDFTTIFPLLFCYRYKSSVARFVLNEFKIMVL